MIIFEDVHAIHGTSAKSNFNFGFNTGSVYTLCLLTGFGVSKCTPKIWQKSLGVKTKGKAIKKEVAKLVSEIIPNIDIWGIRKGLLDGRSDAFGLALYGSIKYK